MRKFLVAALALCPVAASEAATVSYGDEASFLTRLQPGYYQEDFSDYVYGSPLNSSTPSWDYSGGAGAAFSYRASATGGLWSNDSALSTTYAEDSLVIDFTGQAVTAVGGIVAATDIQGNTLIDYEVNVALSDGTLTTITTSGFAGFVSDTPISRITFTSVSAEANVNWPQLDHFYVGAAVPEPGTLAVALGASCLLLPRKRQRAR